MEASQREYCPGSVKVNPITQSSGLMMEILEPFLLLDRVVYGQNLELDKTESREGQGAIEMEIYSIILEAYFNYISKQFSFNT